MMHDALQEGGERRAKGQYENKRKRESRNGICKLTLNSEDRTSDGQVSLVLDIRSSSEVSGDTYRGVKESETD